MRLMNYRSLLCTLCLGLTPLCAATRAVAVTIPNGTNFVLEVDEKETFFEVAEKVGDFVGEASLCKELLFEVEMDEQFTLGRYLSEAASSLDQPILPQTLFTGLPPTRDYYAVMSEGEMNDIRYIVTTLANKSLARILLHKGSLERAGDRIELIHPLRFLQFIFTDEQLKSGMHNIRGKGRIWREFFEGLRDSLNAESLKMNMKEEYVLEMARALNIEPALLMAPIVERRWHDLFDLLLTQVPRNKDHSRYDS